MIAALASLTPVAAVSALFVVLLGSTIDARRALLVAAVAWGVGVVAITEGLSALHLVTRGAVAGLWLVLAVAIAAIGRRALAAGAARVRAAFDERGASLAGLGALDRFLVGGVLLVFALIAAVALLCPPNAWDVMEYHLPRVMLWLSHRSVAFFPTPEYTQVILGPFAEYAVLHVDLLWGGDRFVNLVEVASFAGCVVGASMVARELGASRRGQLLAALACATIPEAVLEASGAMNTAVSSLWTLSMVGFLLACRRDASWLNLACAAAAAGLAILTKGVAYAYLPPLVFALFWTIPREHRANVLRKVPAVVALALALNLPQALRARDLTGSLLGAPFPDGGPFLGYGVAHPSVMGMLANAIRNLSLHFGLPSHAATAALDKAARAAIRALGQDPDDPSSVFMGRMYGRIGHFWIPAFDRNEITVGNFASLVLAGFAATWAFARARAPLPRRVLVLYWGGIGAAFLFFCLMLRWQIWSGRFHLPLFVLAAAPVGVFLERWSTRAQGAVAAVLLLIAVSFATRNDTRSLLPPPLVKTANIYHPRAELYFNDGHRDVAADEARLARALDDAACRDVALDLYNPLPDAQLLEGAPSFVVYPMMALIGADEGRRRIWFEGVHNFTAKYAADTPHPRACAVICMACADVPAKDAEYRGAGFSGTAFGHDVLFTPTPLAGAAAPAP
jgi:hypothetical protein